jgi:hypothetical protein
MGAAAAILDRLLEEKKLSQKEHDDAVRTQRVVCFTEAPLEQAWSFVCPIAGRRQQLEPYGLAFTKAKARERRVNPIWYIDMTPGHHWLMNDVWSLVEQASQPGSTFQNDPMAMIAPFVEGMGTWEGKGRKEFWWEREWRHLGDFHFLLDDIAVVLCPEQQMDDFACHTKCDSGRIVPRIDPTWGLERIIAVLAGVPTS